MISDRGVQIPPGVPKIPRADHNVEIRCAADDSFRRLHVGVEVAEEQKFEWRNCYWSDAFRDINTRVFPYAHAGVSQDFSMTLRQVRVVFTALGRVHIPAL